MDVFRKIMIWMACLTGATAVMAQDHWTCDIHNYEYDMTVYLQLEDNGQIVSGDDYEVAAFCGEECRGVAKEQTVTFLGKAKRYFYLRVRSNTASGESIRFKVYKKSSNMEYDALETLTFQAQEAVGLPSNPFVIHIENETASEAYAVLSPDSTTLTFYYDDLRTTREGTTYVIKPRQQEWGHVRASIQHVVFKPSFAAALPVSTYRWFYKMESLSQIEGLQYLNTSNVADMSLMFAGCSSLTSIDVSHFDTSNVTDMQGLFHFCSSLTSLDLSHFDTSNVTSMSIMFYFCKSLTSLDLSHFDTSNVTDMHNMFDGCNSLTSLDVSHFDTSNVTDIGRMFTDCSSLTSLDVSHFDTSNVTDIGMMFSGCSSLTSLDVSHFDTSNVTSIGYMFDGCNSLTSLDVSHFDTSNVTDMSYLFRNCSSLTSLDVSHFDTSNVTNMGDMFSGCSSLTSLDVSHFDTSNVTDMNNMFSGCSSLTSLDVSHFDTSNVTFMGNMFSDCSSLTSLDLSHFDMTNVNNTQSMLSGCSSLKELSVSSTMENIDATCCTGVGTASTPCTIISPAGFNFGVDTSGDYFRWKGGYFKLVTSEPYVVVSRDRTTLTFYYDQLKDTRTDNLRVYVINPSSTSSPSWYSFRPSVTKVVFDPSFADFEVVYMNRWFRQFEVLEEVEGVENLNLSKLKSALLMFDFCTSLTSLDFSCIQTPVVDDLRGIFEGCSGLTHLDVSGIDVSNARYLSWMFWGCSSLESLDVSHFNTSKVTTFASMFDRCYMLKTVDVTGFNTSKSTSFHSMFEDCFALESVDVTHFDTSKATDMAKMFAHCHTLTSLDVSNFDMDNVAMSDSMFFDCPSLHTFHISASMENLGVDACLGIGTAENPCTLFAPAGFDFGVDTSGDYFQWKGGYFKLGSAFLPGDVNHDGAVNITDAMSVVNKILGHTPVVFFMENAEMNGDGQINITDVLLIVNIILHGNTATRP